MRALRFLTLAIGLALLAFAAHAQTFEEGLGLFAADNFSKTVNGVDAVATSGEDQAKAVLEALRDGKLVADKASGRVYIKSDSGDLLDAATGAPIAGGAPDGLKRVRTNNRVRGLINTALGTLNLLAHDPAVRLAAARNVFVSHDANALPALAKALDKETDPGVKAAMEDARAAVVLTAGASSDDDMIAAIRIVKRHGGQDALALLLVIPPDAPEAVREAADGAIATVKGELALWDILQNGWYGLSLGSVLLLAAIGLAITFGVMGVINMAHGEMVMLGAYTTFVVQEIIRNNAPWLFDWSLAIAIPAAFLVAGLVGIVIERGIIRFLYGRALETLLATWGVSLILQQAVRTIFGPNNREVGNPSWMSGAFDVGNLTITLNRMWIIVFAIGVFVVLLMVLRFTAFGLQMRAVTQNRPMASAMGIRTPWVDAFTFGLGSGIAGIAGVALSQIDNVSPNLGQSYIIDSFLVVVFGGVGNLWGTLVGALSLGVANKFLEPYVGAVLAKIVILVIIILFIQRRPRGLFALKGRAVEA